MSGRRLSGRGYASALRHYSRSWWRGGWGCGASIAGLLVVSGYFFTVFIYGKHYFLAQFHDDTPSHDRWRSGDAGGASMAHDSMSDPLAAGHGAPLSTPAALLPPPPGGATRVERSVSCALPSAAGAMPSPSAEVAGAPEAEACLLAAGGGPAPPPAGGAALQSGVTEPKSS